MEKHHGTFRSLNMHSRSGAVALPGSTQVDIAKKPVNLWAGGRASKSATL